ncbi:MAG: hypothetical protein K2P84_13455, partial [Undibacterium sp.]|nr:hypothetical protein [Undibacterium sp.]
RRQRKNSTEGAPNGKSRFKYTYSTIKQISFRFNAIKSSTRSRRVCLSEIEIEYYRKVIRPRFILVPIDIAIR